MPSSRTTVTLARIFAWLFLFGGICAFLILLMRAFVVEGSGATWFIISAALPALLGGILVWVVLSTLAALTERLDALYAIVYPRTQQSPALPTNQPSGEPVQKDVPLPMHH